MNSVRQVWRSVAIVILLGQIGVQSCFAKDIQWTEEKIGKLAVKADRAATSKNWRQAILYGEEMLEGSNLLYGLESTESVQRLKTLNRYYDKSDRLLEVSERVELAYNLSRKYFPLDHHTTEVSRLLYYKLLIAQERYAAAIPVVWENISILSKSEDDEFKRLHYLQQLHGLYGLTNQIEQREKILIRQLELNKRLLGDDVESTVDIVMNLARAYCLQGKQQEFHKLMLDFGLRFKC